MTDEFGATKGGPEIVDSLLKVTGDAENNTNEISAGSKPKMFQASSIRMEIGIESQTRC